MNGEENLIPMSERSKEEARELGKKGGIASGEARRRKRDIKDTLDLLLSKPFSLNTKGGKQVKQQLKELGIDATDIDNQTAMAYAMFMTAMSGGKSGVSAFNSIRDTLGERPVEEVKQTLDGEITTRQKNAVDDVIKQMKPLSDDDV